MEWRSSKEYGSIVSVAAGNDVLVIGCSLNWLLRLNFVTDEKDAVVLSKRLDDRIHRLFLDPFGHHCLVSMQSGAVLYLHCHWAKPHSLSKLKGHVLESVAWNHMDGSLVGSSGRILLGTARGLILECLLDEKEKDKHVKKLFDLSEGGDGSSAPQPISGLHMELFPDLAEDEPDRFLIIAATPTRQYQFIGGPTFEQIFARYAAQPAFLELPGDLGYSELRCFSKYAEPTAAATSIVAWLTGAGIYYGELRFQQQNDVGEHVLEDGKLLAYPTDPASQRSVPAISLVLSEWHFLLLTESRLTAINALSEEIVYEESFDIKSTGELLGLCFDAALGIIWLFTSRCVLEVKIDNEDSEMWRLFLAQGRYDEALRYAATPQDTQLVLEAQADDHFACRQYQLAAKLYAKTQRPFEEIALKFVQLSAEKLSTPAVAAASTSSSSGAQPAAQASAAAAAASAAPSQPQPHVDGNHASNGSAAPSSAAAPSSSGSAAAAASSSATALDARSALKIYLLEKLEALAASELTQQTMLCTWLTEIFLDNINCLQDPARTPALTEAARQRRQTLSQQGGGGGAAAADDHSDATFSPFRLLPDSGTPQAQQQSPAAHNGRPTAAGAAAPSSSSPSVVGLLDDDPFSSLSADERSDLLDAEVAAFRRFLRERNDCLTGDHRVLTRTGWQSVRHVTVGEQVLSFNIASCQMEWKPVTAVETHSVDPRRAADALFRMQGSGMDVIATRDHRMLLAQLDCSSADGLQQERERPLVYEKVNELLQLTYSASATPSLSSLAHSRSRAVVCAGLITQPAVKVVIPGLEQLCHWWWKQDGQRAFLQFLGFWLRDGYLSARMGVVCIAQRNAEGMRGLELLLPRVFPRSWHRHAKGKESPGHVAYTVRCPPLYDYLGVMAAGPLGYNPRDPQQLRSYPHFTKDEALAAEELRSAYCQDNSSGCSSTWTEAEMLAAFITADHAAPPEGCWHCRAAGWQKGDELLACTGEGCQHGGHLLCDGLSAAPEGDWLCPNCRHAVEGPEAAALAAEAMKEDDNEEAAAASPARRSLRSSSPSSHARRPSVSDAGTATTEPATPRSGAGQRRSSVSVSYGLTASGLEADVDMELLLNADVHVAVHAEDDEEEKLPPPTGEVEEAKREEEEEEEVEEGKQALQALQAGATVPWDNGLWLSAIDGHWFSLKRWLGDQQQIASVYSQLSRQQAVALLDGFCRADGRCDLIQYDDSGEPSGQWSCSSPSFPLIDQLMLIGQLAGAAVDLHLHTKAGEERTLAGCDGAFECDYWQLLFSFTRAAGSLMQTALLARPVDVSRDVAGRGNYQYEDDGRVWCISVQGNSNFLTQRLSCQRRQGGGIGVRAQSVFVGNCLNKATTIELLSSHGRMDEWLLYAKDDLEWVLQQLMQDAQYDQAIALLRRHAQPAKVQELYYKLCPSLIVHRPKDTIDMLCDIKTLDPAKLIPALMRYEEHFHAAQQQQPHAAAVASSAAPPPPAGLSLRYLEHCVYRHRNRDPVVHNYLISLYAAEPDSAPFLRYLDSQKQAPVFDTQYALRVCHERGQQQACVAIYTMMRLYEEAVTLALTFDIPLAKRVIQQAERSVDVTSATAASTAAGGAAVVPAAGSGAAGGSASSASSVATAAPLGAHDVHGQSSVSASIDASTAKRLWLLVAREIIRQHSSSISTAMSLLQDCGALSLEDLLPFFPDFVRIGELKDEIARSLDAYNAAIESLQADMEASTQAAQAIRRDLQALKQRSGAVAINRKCDLCGLPVLSAAFLLFPCTHCYHTDCAKAELQQYWDKHPAMRKKAIADRLQREKERQQTAAAAGSTAAQPARSAAAPAADDWAQLSKAGKEARVLADCVAAECALCGGVMIDSVQLSFVAEQDPNELREIETWKI